MSTTTTGSPSGLPSGPSAGPSSELGADGPRDSSASAVPSGPILVSLGAAGWGAENLFRRRLSDVGIGSYSIVLVEHFLQMIFTLPSLLKNFGAIRTASRRALVYVFLSGALGSALGTVCYTAALGTSMNATVAAVLLNLQPVISTLAGAMLFQERIARPFFLWAPIAIAAGMAIAVPAEGFGSVKLAAQGGLGLVLATVVLWGFSTATGRGAMKELPLGLATPLRLWAGFLTIAVVLALRVAVGGEHLDLHLFLARTPAINVLLLTTLTGVLPLVVYFAGLRTTPASIAGYCEMFYTISATFVGWQLLGDKLSWHQGLAAVLLVVAIVMLNRSQRRAGDAEVEAVRAEAA